MNCSHGDRQAGRATGRRGGLDALSGLPTDEERDREAEMAALKAHSDELAAKLNEQREAHRLELAALADEVEDSRYACRTQSALLDCDD